jgi:hypothetical protein
MGECLGWLQQSCVSVSVHESVSASVSWCDFTMGNLRKKE